MKLIIQPLMIISIFLLTTCNIKADNSNHNNDTIYIIKTYDFIEYEGKIIENNSKVIKILTPDSTVYEIPKYQIREFYSLISKYKNYLNLANNYVINKNAFSLPKSNFYVSYFNFGFDVQYGITDNLDIGLISSWIFLPVIMNIDYSIELNEKFHAGIGSYIGIFDIADAKIPLYMPNFNLTYGTRDNNINIKVGYFGVYDDNHNYDNIVLSFGGILNIQKQFSFSFESIILTGDKGGGYFIPGMRYFNKNGNALQIGFAFFSNSDGIHLLSIPVVNYMKNF